MTAKKSLFLLFLLAISCATASLAASNKPDRGAPTPLDVYNSFSIALQTKDLRTFMKVCSKPLANFSPGLSCGSLLNEAWHQGRTYSKAKDSMDSVGKKAVIELTTKGSDNVTSPLFFLLEQTDHNLWIIKNIIISQQYAAQYLKN